MKYLNFVLTFFALCNASSIYANSTAQLDQSVNQEINNIEKTQALLSVLKTPESHYVANAEDFKLDPRMMKDHYQVGWVKPPVVDVSRKEFVGYKRAVELELTVIASTGEIVESKILKSSGSKLVDRKVQDAIAVAQLERIPYAEANLSYKLVQQFKVEKPI